MHHPVAEGSRADQATFGFMDGKGNIRAGSVGFGPKLLLEPDQVVFQAVLESSDDRLAPFALAGPAIGQDEVVLTAQLRVHVLSFKTFRVS